jgi:hypothetical protein
VSRRLLLFLRAALVVLVVLVVPALAGADAFTQVERAYKKTGTIDACRFSTGTLAAALRQEDTYATQYFQDFSTAVQAALNSRAAGHCQRQTTVQGSLAGAGTGGAPPGSVTDPTSAGVPAPLALIAILAALLAAGGALYAFARSRAWEPLWASDWRHAWTEAGYRLSVRWADLADRRRR